LSIEDCLITNNPHLHTGLPENILLLKLRQETFLGVANLKRKKCLSKKWGNEYEKSTEKCFCGFEGDAEDKNKVSWKEI